MNEKDRKNLELVYLKNTWRALWPAALRLWSRFTKLSQPLWCISAEDEKREGIDDGLAMIRLEDCRVVIGLRRIQREGLEKSAKVIMAHEIGHHVYAPANINDNARLLARIRAGLPGRENYAGFVSNLYTDLLINDRLQRDFGLDVASVFRTLRKDTGDKLWLLYMRVYEILWSLPAGTLAAGELTGDINGDAGLGARIIRAYARDWLDGAGRFACLCLPYLLEIKDNEVFSSFPWMDAVEAGTGETVPEGMAQIDEEEAGGAIHPSSDSRLTGIYENSDIPGESQAREKGKGGRKNNYRQPNAYVSLMKSLGVRIDEKELVVKYYRELALPHLIPYPSITIKEASDPLPEGLEQWEPGAPIADIDWIQTVINSPYVIPGATTVERTFGTTAGGTPEKQPVNLYLGVDCSGSMSNPAMSLSYPVLAGTIVVLSAIRAGAEAMVCLSGEPGEFSETDGFSRNEKHNMAILTGYLGTGYAFGIERLKETFIDKEKPGKPTHILVVTDSDIFSMISAVKNGWSIMKDAAERAGGGATIVLEIPYAKSWKSRLEQLTDCGWSPYLVTDMSGLVNFARAFSRTKYGNGNY